MDCSRTYGFPLVFSDDIGHPPPFVPAQKTKRQTKNVSVLTRDEDPDPVR